ncbi:Ctr copper transporter family protein [Ostertagia ostertagi]
MFRPEKGIHLQHVNHQDMTPLHNDVGRNNSNEDVYIPTTTTPAVTSRSHNRCEGPFTSSSASTTIRLIQASLYVMQLVLAYWLMLIAMTYNAWLTAAATLGAGFGRWSFAVLKFHNFAGETADSFNADA